MNGVRSGRRGEPRGAGGAALVDLLGDTRATLVDLLLRRPSSVAELAAEVGLSEVAVRRHLQVLERDGLVTAETVRRDGPGRPGQRYSLSDRGRRLFPDGSAALANELLDYLEHQLGRDQLLAFLRWRAGRQQQRYDAALSAGTAAADTAPLEARAEALAALLSAEGFVADVAAVTAPDGATTLELTQGHCAVRDVAAAHPELCAYESALFQKVLGARVSRRATIAGGADACVCSITPNAPTTAIDTGAPHGHQG